MVDARTVQGLGVYSDVVTIDVDNAENNEEECEPTHSLLGPDHEFGTFFAAYELLETPDSVFTFDVNVAASDRDPNDDLPESGFLICFAMFDGSELPDGTYSLFRIETHEHAAVSDQRAIERRLFAEAVAQLPPALICCHTRGPAHS